jgi:hypothetical protein
MMFRKTASFFVAFAAALAIAQTTSSASGGASTAGVHAKQSSGHHATARGAGLERLPAPVRFAVVWATATLFVLMLGPVVLVFRRRSIGTSAGGRPRV